MFHPIKKGGGGDKFYPVLRRGGGGVPKRFWTCDRNLCYETTEAKLSALWAKVVICI